MAEFTADVLASFVLGGIFFGLMVWKWMHIQNKRAMAQQTRELKKLLDRMDVLSQRFEKIAGLYKDSQHQISDVESRLRRIKNEMDDMNRRDSRMSYEKYHA